MTHEDAPDREQAALLRLVCIENVSISFHPYQQSIQMLMLPLCRGQPEQLTAVWDDLLPKVSAREHRPLEKAHFPHWAHFVGTKEYPNSNGHLHASRTKHHVIHTSKCIFPQNSALCFADAL